MPPCFLKSLFINYLSTMIDKVRKKLPFLLIKIIGDKGYLGEIKNKFLNIHNIEFESSEDEKSNIGFIVHSKRWIVERTFAWFGKFRRLCRDYETLNSSVVISFVKSSCAPIFHNVFILNDISLHTMPKDFLRMVL